MPSDRNVMERVERREFDDPDVRAYLDKLPVEAVEHRIGTPRIVTIYAEPKGYWHVGDDHPSLADDDPAVMQAIGRCAASRVRGLPLGDSIAGIHPRECGWCQYPKDELLAACDWATWSSRYLISEVFVWSADERWITYERGIRGGEYENPAWRAFWDLHPKERIRRVEALLS